MFTHAFTPARTPRRIFSQCYQDIDFKIKLTAAVVAPMGLVAVVMAISFGSAVFTNDPEKKKHRRETGILIAILITFVIIPAASLVIFQCFVCDDDTNTLRADALVICDSSDSEFVYIRSVGILGVLLWPIGVPLSYLYLLWNHFGPGRDDFKGRVYRIFAARNLLESQASASARHREVSVQHVNRAIATELKEDHEEQLRLFKLDQTAPSYLNALNGEFEPQVRIKILADFRQA